MKAVIRKIQQKQEAIVRYAKMMDIGIVEEYKTSMFSILKGEKGKLKE